MYVPLAVRSSLPHSIPPPTRRARRPCPFRLSRVPFLPPRVICATTVIRRMRPAHLQLRVAATTPQRRTQHTYAACRCRGRQTRASSVRDQFYCAPGLAARPMLSAGDAAVPRLPLQLKGHDFAGAARRMRLLWPAAREPAGAGQRRRQADRAACRPVPQPGTRDC